VRTTTTFSRPEVSLIKGAFEFSGSFYFTGGLGLTLAGLLEFFIGNTCKLYFC
jgi:hypothetical protein